MNRQQLFDSLEVEITKTIVMRSIKGIDDNEFIFNGEPLGDIFFKTTVETIHGERNHEYNEPDEFIIVLDEISVNFINSSGKPYKRINERINEIMSNKINKKL